MTLGARDAGLLGAFLLLSLVIFGRGVLAHFGSVVAATPPGIDPSQVSWILAWTAHSVVNFMSPLYSTALYLPRGVNEAWAPLGPLPGIVLTPLIRIAGPYAAYNLLILSAPGLAAWTAYLLCRQLVPAAFWAAVAGGMVFGFGTYEVVELDAHLNLALIALVPLIALVVLLRWSTRLSRPWFLGLLAVLLAAQMLTSLEIFATCVGFGLLALFLAAAVAGRGTRAEVVALAVECMLALGIALVLCSPYLYELFHGGNSLFPRAGGVPAFRCSGSSRRRRRRLCGACRRRACQTKAPAPRAARAISAFRCSRWSPSTSGRRVAHASVFGSRCSRASA